MSFYVNYSGLCLGGESIQSDTLPNAVIRVDLVNPSFHILYSLAHRR